MKEYILPIEKGRILPMESLLSDLVYEDNIRAMMESEAIKCAETFERRSKW